MQYLDSFNICFKRKNSAKKKLAKKSRINIEKIGNFLAHLTIQLLNATECELGPDL